MPRPDHLQFGALVHGSGGHIAGWRHPRANPDGELDIDFHVRLARLLEDAGFTALFVADVVAVWGHQLDSLHRTTRADYLEPITLLAALAPQTSRIGLVATATTSYNEPYNLARKFASLDHISGGRAGWNVVTSVVPLEAANFGRAEHFGHAERYARAAEFVDVVKGLWDSNADGALIRDKASGVYIDPARRFHLDHRGEHFTVAGPLNLARPPQGHPVLFQAGASPTGRAFAARVGEVIFTAPVSVAEAVDYRTRLDADVTAAGRDPGDVRVWPILTPIVADTDAEAAEILAELGSLIHDDVLRRLVQDNFGDEDFSDLDLDEPLPDFGTATNRSQSRRAGLLALARGEQLTLRQLALRFSARADTVGAATTVADRIAAVWATGAVDGFNVSFPYLPEQAERFTAEVLPILADRGLFRPPTGTTLREQLGLERAA
ncbi:LLM class flavin-dependent oxidoreductase [Dactylosporangium vinaceum]|uniref:LLM class flavin-dependent oxidoreductase n=1 Tax=Dactylosporangium vinaceum TaxID=53362 RepID=A0ABV5M347_9ACTN|nr:LLM class flavin-dependent oxidoreductase [Dactylosporangium vinaceum]UAB99813.1 LLM class flavin-dependent oxidoreductase [Dactylosporangium vinaceum]